MKNFAVVWVCAILFISSAFAQNTEKKKNITINSYAELFVKQDSANLPLIVDEGVLIDRIFFEEKKDKWPSFVWYQSNFSDQKVRLQERSLDSLPDEIILNLVKKGETPFTFPIKKKKTSDYGWRWNRPHRGVDIGLNTGDSVFCCFDGVVRVAKPLGAYGNVIVVRHYNGLETVYGHLSKINVKPMQKIKSGEVLGLGGSTGRSTGPHLHFECRFQYEAFDPEWILDFETYSIRSTRLYLDKTYFGIEAPSKTNKQYYSFNKDQKECKSLVEKVK